MKNNKNNVDEREIIRKEAHPTRAPRLEGKVKNANQNPIKKPKKKKKN